MELERLVQRPRKEGAVRIGIPDWSAAKILAAGLSEGKHLTVETARPAELAARFARHELDCALLAPLEGVQATFARAVPGIGLSSRGEAVSEAVVCREEPHGDLRVGIDPSDGARAEVARIVLVECFGAQPQVMPLGAQPEEAFDAVVVSGDAGRAARPAFPLRYDVGFLWTELTGLPLVHAMWFCARQAPLPRLRQIFAGAALKGAESLTGRTEHAVGAQATSVVPTPGIYRYRMGSDEMEAVRMLLRMSGEHGLCARGLSLELC
jgi:predicted solute-binding protein